MVTEIYNKISKNVDLDQIKLLKTSILERYLSREEISLLKQYSHPTVVIRGFHKFKSLDFLFCVYCKQSLSVVTINRVIAQGELKSCSMCSPLLVKETCLSRYGVDNYTKTKEWKTRVETTCLEKYNESWPTKSSMVQSKLKNTCIERYGVDNPAKHKKIKEKQIQTCMERYGGPSPQCSDIVLKKIRDVNVIKYGHPRGPKQNSKIQEELSNWIKNFQSIQKNHIIQNKDLDIYIHEKKLAIEVNGDYWHSIEFKNPNYHLKKTEECEKQGIRLIHIWESEWNNNQDYCKYVIKCYLNGKIPDIQVYNGKLPRDYFQVLDFTNKTEKPILEKSGKFKVYKTGYILL